MNIGPKKRKADEEIEIDLSAKRQKTNQLLNLLDLPSDALQQVFSFLEPVDLREYLLVNKASAAQRMDAIEEVKRYLKIELPYLMHIKPHLFDEPSTTLEQLHVARTQEHRRWDEMTEDSLRDIARMNTPEDRQKMILFYNSLVLTRKGQIAEINALTDYETKVVLQGIAGSLGYYDALIERLAIRVPDEHPWVLNNRGLALGTAYQFGHVIVVKNLLSLYGDEYPMEMMQNFLLDSSENGDVEMFNLFLNHLGEALGPFILQNAFLKAIRNNHLSVVQAIASNEIAHHKLGAAQAIQTCLAQALASQCREISKIILNRWSNVISTTYIIEQLRRATLANRPDITETLFLFGPRISGAQKAELIRQASFLGCHACLHELLKPVGVRAPKAILHEWLRLTQNISGANDTANELREALHLPRVAAAPLPAGYFSEEENFSDHSDDSFNNPYWRTNI